MSTKAFPTKHLIELVYANAGTKVTVPDGDRMQEYTVLVNRIDGKSRWRADYQLVFSVTDRYYSVFYDRGSTEYQDEGPFEDEGDTVDCTEVKPVEKTVTDYIPVEN